MGLKTLVTAAAAGAAVQYLLDPELGRTRRARLKDQLGATARRPARELSDQAAKTAQYTRDRATGVFAEATRNELDEWPASDAVLRDKVRSEVLGREPWDRKTINVAAAHRVVTLHGELDSPEQSSELEAAVRGVTGVRDVENNTHFKGTPAPTRT